jgi:Cys-rich protein (TIGR01571 family)
MTEFESGLCGCFEDCGICLKGSCFPGCLAADNWAKANGNECSIFDYCCLVSSFWTRELIRKHFNLSKDRGSDCCTVCCCHPLAICQDARNLKILENKRSPGQPLTSPISQ